MADDAEIRHAPELERHLLRRSIVAQVAGRDACRACDRTPLVGERMHVYEDGRVLCELCRARHREQPVRSLAVRGSEFGHAVRPAPQRLAA